MISIKDIKFFKNKNGNEYGFGFAYGHVQEVFG
jgi:hypothetical protein